MQYQSKRVLHIPEALLVYPSVFSYSCNWCICVWAPPLCPTDVIHVVIECSQAFPVVFHSLMQPDKQKRGFLRVSFVSVGRDIKLLVLGDLGSAFSRPTIICGKPLRGNKSKPIDYSTSNFSPFQSHSCQQKYLQYFQEQLWAWHPASGRTTCQQVAD